MSYIDTKSPHLTARGFRDWSEEYWEKRALRRLTSRAGRNFPAGKYSVPFLTIFRAELLECNLSASLLDFLLEGFSIILAEVLLQY